VLQACISSHAVKSISFTIYGAVVDVTSEHIFVFMTIFGHT